MPADHTRCRVTGCGNSKRPLDVMCSRDWRLVPEPLRAQIWLYFRTKRGRPEHLAAIAEAIRVVEEQRGPRQVRLFA